MSLNTEVRRRKGSKKLLIRVAGYYGRENEVIKVPDILIFVPCVFTICIMNQFHDEIVLLQLEKF
jgi:hypothetical protein